MDKLYSVIIPTRNRPEQFNVALDSVLKQTEPNIEIIAVNDGSNDSALLKYKNIEKKYSGLVNFIYLMQKLCNHLLMVDYLMSMLFLLTFSHYHR